MADDNNNPAPPVPPANEPPAAPPAAPPVAPPATSPANDAPAAPPAKTFTQEEIDARLEEAKKQWEKDKDLPELERLKKRNEELEMKEREAAISRSFNAAAETLQAKNIDRLRKLVGADLEINDDGKIKNLDAVLKQAKIDFPELFPEKPSGSADGATGKEEQKLTLQQQVDQDFAKTGRKHAFKL